MGRRQGLGTCTGLDRNPRPLPPGERALQGKRQCFKIVLVYLRAKFRSIHPALELLPLPWWERAGETGRRSLLCPAVSFASLPRCSPCSPPVPSPPTCAPTSTASPTRSSPRSSNGATTSTRIPNWATVSSVRLKKSRRTSGRSDLKCRPASLTPVWWRCSKAASPDPSWHCAPTWMPCRLLRRWTFRSRRKSKPPGPARNPASCTPAATIRTSPSSWVLPKRWCR